VQDRKKALVLPACLALALGLASCGGCGGGGGGSGGPGEKRLNLVIGDSIPLTGGLAALGPSAEKASDLASAQIDHAIEETGSDHNVKVVHADEGADAAAAIDSARKLVKSDGANCLTGPWVTDDAMQVAQSVATPNGVLEIFPSVTSSDVTDLEDHDLVDRTALPETLEGTALAKGIAQELGGAEGHTVNVAAINNAYGDSLTEAFIEAWQGQGGTVGGQVIIAPPTTGTSSTGVSTTSSYGTTTSSSSGYSGSSGYSYGSSSYSSEASQITSGSPDVVLVIADPTTFASLGPAIVSTGTDPSTIWGSDQLVLPGLGDQVGTDVVNGMHAVAPGAPSDADASTAFNNLFQSSAPHKVSAAPFAAQEFDATILCYLAAVAAGSTDGQRMADKLVDITAPGGDKFSWQQLSDAIKALQDGNDIDFTGASGPIDLDVNGDPTNGTFNVYQYTDGALKVTGDVAVSKPNQPSQ
jgi:ABC-type branched-subunit amino acid transport system substrate-binding protein